MERGRTRTRIPAATVLERAGPLLVLALVAAGLRLEPRAFATPPPGVGKPTVAFLRKMSAAAPFRLMAANLDFPAPYGLSGTIVSAGTVFKHAPSPDGKWIASRADANAPGVFELFVVRLEAGDAVCASGSTPAGTGVNIVAWARNSKRLAFLGQMDHTFRELYTTRIDKPARIRVSKPPASGGRVNGFQGSPNGSRIAYVGDMDTKNQAELYLTRPDRGKTVKLSAPMQPMGSITAFDWFPSGAGLVSRADDLAGDQDEALSVNTSGKKATRLNGLLASGSDVTRFDAASKGNRVALTVDGASVGSNRMFVATPNGEGLAEAVPMPLNGYVNELR